LGAINLMRNMFQSKQIVINPRCYNLIRQVQNATWNHKATDFAKGGKMEGHYDLVAALKYMCRNVSKTHNPFPSNWRHPGHPGGPPAGSYVGNRYYARLKKGNGLRDNTPLSKLFNKKGK
jgi:hypothetical protein